MLFKDSFLNELADMISKYDKDGASLIEKKIAHTPARVLESLIYSYYMLGIGDAKENNGMSCQEEGDMLSILDVIETTSIDFASMYGPVLYNMFVKNITSYKYEKNVVPEYVMPYVIAVSCLHFLGPCIKDSDIFIRNHNKIDITKS